MRGARCRNQALQPSAHDQQTFPRPSGASSEAVANCAAMFDTGCGGVSLFHFMTLILVAGIGFGLCMFGIWWEVTRTATHVKAAANALERIAKALEADE